MYNHLARLSLISCLSLQAELERNQPQSHISHLYIIRCIWLTYSDSDGAVELDSIRMSFVFLFFFFLVRFLNANPVLPGYLFIYLCGRPKMLDYQFVMQFDFCCFFLWKSNSFGEIAKTGFLCETPTSKDTYAITFYHSYTHVSCTWNEGLLFECILWWRHTPNFGYNFEKYCQLC